MVDKAILWTARVLSIFTLFFIGMFLAGELFSEQTSIFNSTKEVILFCFFPIGLCLGLVVSWKNSLVGGIIGSMSMIAFHIIEPSIGFLTWFDLLTLPAVLFLLHGSINLRK